MKILQHGSEFDQYVQNETMLLVLIGSHTCAPCGAIQEKIEFWRQTRQNVQFLYIPIEKFTDVCSQAGIFSIPVMLVYVQGKLFLRENGVFSVAEVLGKADHYLHMLNP